MSYRFMFGPSGSGKSSALQEMLLTKAGQAIEQGNLSENYVLLVPDQYSMQTQKEIVSRAGRKGILNIDVLSFGRLTHRIFEEVGVPQRAALDETGKTLLIKRAAEGCADSLRILGRSIHYPGMVAEVKSVLSEFMQYRITEEELGRMLDFATERGQGALSARLDDLRTLYSAFMKAKRDRFITSEETLDLVAEAIPSSDWVKRSEFVLDGFTGFTPVQYRVIAALIRCGRDVTIALDYGNDGGPSPAWVRKNRSAGREDALFYLSRKTVCDIERMAVAGDLPRKEDILVEGAGEVPRRFLSNPVLAHLEQHIFRHPQPVFHAPSDGRIRIFETDTPEEEVRQILIEVKRLTLSKGYHYRDISVVCGDLARYAALFEKEAPGYGIPYYIDARGTAGLNPLTEAVRSALMIRPQGFSYTAVFRYLRSGMSGLSRRETDLLENYCLAHGIRGRRKWGISFDAQTEPLRKKFLSEIEPVAGSIETERIPAATAAERTRAVYAFMTGLSMEEKMQEMSDAFQEAGDYVRAGQYSQLYRRVVSLLEQIYDLLGDEKISAKEYLELLEAGFTEIRPGTVPQQADRVLIGDIERTRLSECRVLFFAGVNDGNIPRGTSRGGLLSDLDREFLGTFLKNDGTELSPSPRLQMCLQRLYLYMNMTKPTDSLYLSFARTTPEGASLRPSYLIRMVGNLFPDAAVEHPQLLPAGQQLTGERDSIAWLSGALRQYAQGGLGRNQEADTRKKEQEYSGEEPHRTEQPDISEDAVRTAYGYLVRNGSEKTRRAAEKLKEAAFFRYEPAMISDETAQALYGRSIRSGISRMETAAQCLLRQFLQYGLALARRDEHTIEPADTGTILHESLDRFSEKLRRNGLSWNSFTKAEGHQLASEALMETAASYKDLLMYSTARSSRQLARMERILERSTDTLQYQLQKGLFVPEEYEFAFGRGNGAPSLQFPLPGGRQLYLSGRIDRLDLCRDEGRIFVKILDYKSGALDLETELIRRGIQLQLILYMEAAIRDLAAKDPGAQLIPSAMLYYRITDPVISGNRVSDKSGGNGAADEAAALSAIRADLRPTGMVLSEPYSYRRLDRYIDKKSDVIPLSLKKDGEPSKGSHVYSMEEFGRLTDAVNETVCRLAGEILAGSADASPAVWKDSAGVDRTACDHCPYIGVCGFDPAISGYRYRGPETGHSKSDHPDPCGPDHLNTDHSVQS